MATIIQFQERLQTLANREELERLVFYAIKETKKIAISLQKQQLSEGRNNEDKEIGTYSRSTELNYLFGKGPKPRQPKIEGEPYNFEDTGGLFDGMTLQFDKDQVSFWSTDEKTPFLVIKYKGLLGLDEYNLKNYVQNAVFPIFMREFRKVLKI